MALRPILGLFRKAFDRWDDDDCLRLGAALSFYALFSLFPLVLVCMTIVGFFLGDGDETRARILGLIPLPADSVALVDDTLVKMQQHESARGVGALVGLVLLFVGASAVFSELDYAFNRFWSMPQPKAPERSIRRTILVFLETKLASLVLVLLAGIFVLGSLVMGTALGALQSSLGFLFPFAWAWDLLETGVSATLLTLTSAALFRSLPRARVAWRDVGWGAILTTFFLTISKRAIAWYLAHLGSFAAYGVVGGILALLTWIFLTTQIIYFGGEFTRVYAEEVGSLRSAPRNEARDDVEGEGRSPEDRSRAHALPERPVGR